MKKYTVEELKQLNKEEIIAVTAAFTGYAMAVNLAGIRTKVTAAAMALWNGAVKVFNILMPIANTLIHGLSYYIQRYVLDTNSAARAQMAFNKSLTQLKGNALAMKTAYGMLHFLCFSHCFR